MTAAPADRGREAHPTIGPASAISPATLGDRAGPGPSRQFMAIVVLLAVLGFVLNLGIALTFDSLGVFDQFNVLFNADPNVRLEGFAHGTGGHGVRGVVHPNLAHFVNPPVRAISACLAAGGDHRHLRRTIGVLVVPCAGAATMVCLCLLLRSLGLSTLETALVALAHAFGFSLLIFGSIPEHFGLTGLLMVVTLLLVVRSVDDRRAYHPTSIVLCGLLLVGITVTNALAYGVMLLMLFRRLYGGWRRPLLALARTLAIVGAGNAAVFLAAYPFYGRVEFVAGIGTHVQFVSGDHVASRAWAFLRALPGTLMAPDPDVAPNDVAVHFGSRIPFMFTFDRPERRGPAPGLPGLPVALLLGLGLLGLMRGDAKARSIGLVCLAVLLANGAMHAVYGQEFFLYTQHWHFACVVMLAGALRVPERIRPVARVAVGATVALLLVNNARVLWVIVATLAAVGRA